eukprot:SAG22_NODE_754_length_7443_cov_4.952478_5_plen_253_part_00
MAFSLRLEALILRCCLSKLRALLSPRPSGHSTSRSARSCCFVSPRSRDQTFSLYSPDHGMLKLYLIQALLALQKSIPGMAALGHPLPSSLCPTCLLLQGGYSGIGRGVRPRPPPFLKMQAFYQNRCRSISCRPPPPPPGSAQSTASQCTVDESISTEDRLTGWLRLLPVRRLLLWLRLAAPAPCANRQHISVRLSRDQIKCKADLTAAVAAFRPAVPLDQHTSPLIDHNIVAPAPPRAPSLLEPQLGGSIHI